MSQQPTPEPAAEAGGLPAPTGRATLGAIIGNMLEFYDFITYIPHRFRPPSRRLFERGGSALAGARTPNPSISRHTN